MEDVVVVGAGITGTCVALHLARAGRNVLLLEAGQEAGCGTTGAGAGFVGLWAAVGAYGWGQHEAALEQYGIDFYRDVAKYGDIGLRNSGNAYLALLPETVETRLSEGAANPLSPSDARMVDADASARMLGAQPGVVAGMLLHPDGIQVSAGKAAAVVLDLAVEAGVEVRFGAAVSVTSEGPLVDGERVDAEAVVLATGAWTPGLLTGLTDIPTLRPVITTRVNTLSPAPSIPTIMGMDVVPCWIREYDGFWCYGFPGGYRPLDLSDLPEAGDRPSDADLATKALDVPGPYKAAIPTLDGAGASWIQGVPVYTHDALFFAGPVPGLERVWTIFGCNEAGVTHGPGLARHVSQLVCGEPTSVPAERYALDRPPVETPVETAIERGLVDL